MTFPPKESLALQPLVHAGQGGVEWAAEGPGNLSKLLPLVDPLANDVALSSGELVDQLAQPANVVSQLGRDCRAGARVGGKRRVVAVDSLDAVRLAADHLLALEQHGLVIGHGEQP